MQEMDLSNYESRASVPVVPSASTNRGFVPDEDSIGTLKSFSAPLRHATLTAGQQIASPSFPPLSREEIRRACHFYATERCCHGSGFIENMTMTEVSDRIAYHYMLESYGEKRETAEQTRPYRGEAVDGPEGGPEPRPWDVPVTSSKDFQNAKKIVEIPHTSHVKECPKCGSRGTHDCKWCFGKGGSGCVLCLSSKRFRPCTNCKYSSRRCMICDGRGTEKCSTCDGQGKLRVYKILIVTWTNHQDHFVTDTLSLPPDEIASEAKGRQLFTEEAEELTPVWNVPCASVIEASTRLIDEHRSGLGEELIRRQRHTVQAIPFTQVKYCWRGEVGHFYVYGLQKKAYFEDYPQQCCCCCSIM